MRRQGTSSAVMGRCVMSPIADIREHSISMRQLYKEIKEWVKINVRIGLADKDDGGFNEKLLQTIYEEGKISTKEQERYKEFFEVW